MILNREDFFKAVNVMVGDRTDDDAMKFVDDMADTYQSFEDSQADDWKKRYEDNDRAWRRKYQNRFFSGNGRVSAAGDEEIIENEEENEKHIDDLFTDD